VTLPPVPLDDVALAQLEHALGTSLTFQAPDGTELDEPIPYGGEYTLPTLLDFWAGVREDPDGVVRQVGEATGIPVFYDPRPHYSERDVIRALVTEVRRLRDEAAAPARGNQDDGSA
jgi:hypothetical protein